MKKITALSLMTLILVSIFNSSVFAQVPSCNAAAKGEKTPETGIPLVMQFVRKTVDNAKTPEDLNELGVYLSDFLDPNFNTKNRRVRHSFGEYVKGSEQNPPDDFASYMIAAMERSGFIGEALPYASGPRKYVYSITTLNGQIIGGRVEMQWSGWRAHSFYTVGGSRVGGSNQAMFMGEPGVQPVVVPGGGEFRDATE